jgi:hypothetical protein
LIGHPFGTDQRRFFLVVISNISRSSSRVRNGRAANCLNFTALTPKALEHTALAVVPKGRLAADPFGSLAGCYPKELATGAFSHRRKELEEEGLDRTPVPANFPQEPEKQEVAYQFIDAPCISGACVTRESKRRFVPPD